MYYYAYLNENDIVVGIYAFPTTITHSQYIQIPSDAQTLIGKHFNRNTLEFEDVYYYAILNNKAIATEVTYSYTAITESNYIAITAEQYNSQSVVGMYWNGTAFVTAPISLLAVASTDTVNYKQQDMWLSTKLDEMDEAITGKAATVHAHSASDISGVVKTINGTVPDENGNVVVASGSGVMTAAEILDTVKTVDGAGSGLDADTLDGLEATAFAAANHTHSQYLTEDDVDFFATNARVTEAVSGKANAVHTHAMGDVTGLTAALAGKSDTSHTHRNYLPTRGGTVSGNLSVNGVVRVQGQQCIFNSGEMVTLATNNLPTMIAGSQIYSKTEITVSSDERLKEGIGELDEIALLEFIKRLIIVEYNYIGEENEEKHIGVIAQDVIMAHPEIAKYFVVEDNDGYLGVKTADLVYPLIAAVQQLAKEIEFLKKQK